MGRHFQENRLNGRSPLRDGNKLDSTDSELSRFGQKLGLNNNTVLHNLTNRNEQGVQYWPDGVFGFATIDGVKTTYCANGASIGVATMQESGRYNVNSINISGVESGVDYAGGGPVYDTGTGTLYMIYHGEEWSAPVNPDYFWSFLGLAKSTDNGESWAHVTRIVEPQANKAAQFAANDNTEVGGGPFIIKDGFMYVYFKEMLTGGTWLGCSVARCPIANIENANSWNKWNGSGWTEPGLGGSSVSVVDDTAQTRWLEVVQTTEGDVIICSSCHINNLWSIRHCVAPSSDPLNFGGWITDIHPQEPSLFYAGLLSDKRFEGNNIIDLNEEVQLLYLESELGGGVGRWDDAQLVSTKFYIDGIKQNFDKRITAVEQGSFGPVEDWIEVEETDLEDDLIYVSARKLQYYKHGGRGYCELGPMMHTTAPATTDPNGKIAFTLPSGYRPPVYEQFPLTITDGTTGVPSILSVGADGRITIFGTNSATPIALGYSISWRID